MRTRILSGLLLLLAACAKEAPPPAAAEPQEVTFTGTNFAFTGPDSIAPGMTAITFVNHGTQNHHLILGRLDDGKTEADLMAYLDTTHTMAPPAFLAMRGAANGIAPNAANTSVIDLDPGHYVAICFLPDPADGTSHVMKGMIKELVVAGPPDTAASPTADIEARTSDYRFTLPPLTAGHHVIHYVNDGPQAHEIQLVRLNDGATAESFLAALEPGATAPPPGTFMGGPGVLSAGTEDYWNVDLEPGHYMLLCLVPDTDGMPHALKGMVQEFTVPAG